MVFVKSSSMKKSFLNLVFVLFGLNLLAQQTKILSSKIISVDIFRNEAQIKREARVALEPGEFELVFEKISSKLSSESIEVLAPEGVDVLSVSKKNYYLTEEDKPAEIIALQDSIQIVKDQLNNLRWEREAVQIQKDLLLSNKQIGGNGVGVKADELEDVLGVFQRKLLEFKLENSRIEKSEKELLLIKTILDKQYNEFNSGKIGLNNQILVQVKVNKSIPQAKFELQYMVRGVSWKPSYDIRVKDSQSPIQFVLKAGITQSTGENWNGVSMKLSSANPQIGGNKPDLNTQFISLSDPIVYKNLKKQRTNSSYETGEGDGYAALEVAAAPFSAGIEQTMLSLNFDVKGLAYVQSDNKLHHVELSNFVLPASFGFAAVPKLSEDVFVTATVENNDLITQLSGEASIYMNGTFAGKTQLYPQNSDSLLLTLGKDRRLGIRREKVKDKNSKSLFGSNKKELQTIELTLNNTAKESIEVKVEDQIPVSTNNEITVKLLSQDGASYVAETGKLIWNVKLAPKQVKKIRFSFEVSYPSEKILNGF